MGRERIILGESKIITKGDHWIFSENDIQYTSLNKIEEVGIENGISIGNESERVAFSNSLSTLIEDAYWIDKENSKTNLMDIDSDIIQFYIKFTPKAKGKNFSITVRSLDSVIDDDLSDETDFVVEKENAYFKFNLNARNFQKGGDAIQKLYFYVKIKGEGSSKYPLSKEDYLKVHVIRYVPQVMRAQSPSWEIAAKCQEVWFKKEKKQKPNYSEPVTDIITMDWVLKYDRIKPTLDKIKNNMWETENSINLFCKRINEMISNGDLILPKDFMKISNFNFFNNNVLRKKDDNQFTTLLDRYYVNEISYKSSLMDSLDDLYGSLGDFLFRITPAGYIAYIGKNIFQIRYKKIAIYLVDSFDFQDGDFSIITPSTYTSQPLGYWDIYGNRISKHPTSTKDYYIDNKSYQDYQDDYNKGGDYMLISDYEEIDVDFTFNIKRNFLGLFNRI